MASARMGEITVSANPGDELVALGLGSCIGLAIVDRTAGIAGLVHVVLPESNQATGPAGKFADLAVPELIRQLRALGAVERRLQTVLVGGARMFEMSGGLDIGARNEKAVRSALAAARITVHAHQTGGNQGRTVRVSVGEGVVTCRTAGTPPVTLLPASGRGARPDAGARPTLTGLAGGRA
jgi:chemotaxis protein CheD